MTSADPGSEFRWQVRAPVDVDFARWRELYQGYAEFYRTPQADAAARQVWSWIVDPQHEVNCLLAEDSNGLVAGLAHYRAFARPLSASTGCFLDDLFVDPACRGPRRRRRAAARAAPARPRQRLERHPVDHRRRKRTRHHQVRPARHPYELGHLRHAAQRF